MGDAQVKVPAELVAEADSEVFTQYVAALRSLVDAGAVSLLPMGLPGVAPEKKFGNIATCRLPAYQMALFHAKKHADAFLFVSDLDEILVPMPGAGSLDVEAAMGAFVRDAGLRMDDFCYARIHGDEVNTADEDVDRTEPLWRRFPRRCDCEPLLPLPQRPSGNVGGSCGIAYTKAMANVRTTWLVSIHSHSACTAHRKFHKPSRNQSTLPIHERRLHDVALWQASLLLWEEALRVVDVSGAFFGQIRFDIFVPKLASHRPG